MISRFSSLARSAPVRRSRRLLLALSTPAAACAAGMMMHVLPAGARFDPPTGVATLP